MRNVIVPSTFTARRTNKRRRFEEFKNTLKDNAVLKALGQAIVYSTVKSNEPRVWQKCDRQGNTYWVAYDPAINCKATFSSEKEVRIWLDERYYL